MTDIEKLEQLLEDFKIESITNNDRIGKYVSIEDGAFCVFFNFNEDGSFRTMDVE